MKYILDTNSVSFALRGHGDVGARIRACRPSDLGISAITLAELRYGADRKGSRKLHGLIDTFASAVEVVSFDEAAAAEFGRIGSMLAERGTLHRGVRCLDRRACSGSAMHAGHEQCPTFLEGAWTIPGKLDMNGRGGCPRADLGKL